MRGNRPDIPTPTNNIIISYLRKWDTLENYVLQESSLQKLFTKTYPKNDDIDEILIKVCSLNDFYSTNIFSPFTVAKHILSLKIDSRLKNRDTQLVNDIALVSVKEDKSINFYSFATKYCHQHFQMDYPIYDNYVEKMLLYFKKRDRFHPFKKPDLKYYPVFKEVILAFRTYYHLTSFDLKDIDRYLWLAGKEYFPRKY
ncbi:MAG TPA: hypothetical protein ENN33_12490 [Ignavibacteria bacterium]|nr:hypothetical protein [Ignavibacteria bacterium]